MSDDRPAMYDAEAREWQLTRDDNLHHEDRLTAGPIHPSWDHPSTPAALAFEVGAAGATTEGRAR